jgi:hypothetical protein
MATNGEKHPMNLKAEYESDFYAWLDHNIMLLKERRLAEVDVDNLIEELVDMGREKRGELVSRFMVLIAHLLKWQFQLQQLSSRWQEFEGRSWRKTIIEQRLQIENQLEDNPSLKPYLDEAVNKAYPKAVRFAIKETGLKKSNFPNECPYTTEQLLDYNFYPQPE